MISIVSSSKAFIVESVKDSLVSIRLKFEIGIIKILTSGLKILFKPEF